jgi:YegS/Rv2252/BmrU family lipid kinase
MRRVRTLVIVNPASRSGATGRRWRRVEPRVREVLGPLEVEFTRAPRDAERIAREGVRSGIERVVVAGGDGTLNEAASGLLAAELGGYARIALLPLGTGGDFVRSLGVPRDLDGALACMTGGALRPVDAGRLEYRGAGGRAARGWFVNVASVGIAALVEEITRRTTRAFGGTAAFAIGAVRGVLRYRSLPVRVLVDGELLFDGPVVVGAVANGHSFGGGMCVAPRARADDGLLDVVVQPARSKLALLAKLPGLYRGSHLADPDVRSARGKRIELDADPDTVRLEADGDPLGTLPAVIEVVPGALTFYGPPA